MGFAQYHPYDPQYYIFGGTLGLRHGFAGSQYRAMFLCQKAGVRQLVFCVGCSFSARMHSTTVSTMSGRVYPTGVSTPISRR